MRDKITLHHLVPESHGGTRHPDNMRKLRDKTHSAFHAFFSNRTPIQQIRQITTFNSSALNDEVVQRVVNALSEYQGEDELYAYRSGVLVPRKFLAYEGK